jgi:hypothetical protein
LSPDTVSIHLNMAAYNKAGLVFGNTDLKVVVLRWLDQSNLEVCQELVDFAFDEMAGINSNALICDMRNMPGEVGQPNCIELAIQCVSSRLVERFVVLGGANCAQLHPPSPDVLEIASERGLPLLVCEDFAEAANWLDSLQSNPEGPWLTKDLPVNFWASYGGSTYSLTEYSCTVFRTTGNRLEASLVAEALQKSYDLHRETGATAGIVDTTANPPLAHQKEYLFAYKEVVQPMTSGAYKQIIHVRSGDILFPQKDAPPLSPLLESLGIPFFEVETLQRAISLMRVLQGKTPSKVAR